MRPLGFYVAVRSNQVEMVERIQREVLLPHWEIHPQIANLLFSFYVGGEVRPGTRRFTLLYEGNHRLARSHDVEEVYRLLEQSFHRRLTAYASQTFVRGLALSLNGRAELVLGAGPSFVRQHRQELLRAGASLLAPEFVGLSDGLVHPYLNRVQGAPSLELGLPLASEPVPLGRLWRMAPTGETGPLTPARAAFHLFECLQRAHDARGALQELTGLLGERDLPALNVPDYHELARGLASQAAL